MKGMRYIERRVSPIKTGIPSAFGQRGGASPPSLALAVGATKLASLANPARCGALWPGLQMRLRLEPALRAVKSSQSSLNMLNVKCLVSDAMREGIPLLTEFLSRPLLMSYVCCVR